MAKDTQSFTGRSFPFDRLLGGGIFRAITGLIALGCATQSVMGMIQGVLFGAFVGGLVAFNMYVLFTQEVPWPQVHDTPSRCRSGIVYGISLTRNFTLFLVVPFTVVCSTVVVFLLVLFSVLTGGIDSGIRLLESISNYVFWIEGVFLHALVLATAVSLMMEFLLRYPENCTVQPKSCVGTCEEDRP